MKIRVPSFRYSARVDEFIRWFAVLAIFVASCGVCAERSQAPFDEAAFDRFMVSHLQKTGIPGISVAISDGISVTMTKGYGRDGRGARLTEHSPMFIGSLSKSITAVAVMQLVEKGQVGLETPVHQYLPDFQLADSRYLRITVRHLLNQRSGMSDRTYFEWSLPGPRSLGEALQNLRVATLAAQPGSDFNYHNRNYDVVARLVEVVSGEPFAVYLRKNVFDPLGMYDASVVERLDDPNGVVAPGHIFAFGRAIAISAPSFLLSGSGGVVASAADMAQWLLFQARGGETATGTRLLSEASMSLMHRASGSDSRYGFGWVDQSSQQPPRVLHAGWSPTFTSFQSLSRNGRHDLAILSNGGRTFLNGSTASYISLGVLAIEGGRAPQSFGESTRNLDLVLGGAALLVLVTTFRALWRTRQWAERTVHRAPWSKVARLAPLGIILALVITIPKIVGDALGGREASWNSVMEPSVWVWLFYVSPVGVIWVATVALSCMAVLIARIFSLMQVAHPGIALRPSNSLERSREE